MQATVIHRALSIMMRTRQGISWLERGQVRSHRVKRPVWVPFLRIIWCPKKAETAQPPSDQGLRKHLLTKCLRTPWNKYLESGESEKYSTYKTSNDGGWTESKKAGMRKKGIFLIWTIEDSWNGIKSIWCVHWGNTGFIRQGKSGDTLKERSLFWICLCANPPWGSFTFCAVSDQNDL